MILFARETTKWLCSITRKPPGFDSKEQTIYDECIDENYYSGNNFMGIKVIYEN